jgi:hypothetical protein
MFAGKKTRVYSSVEARKVIRLPTLLNSWQSVQAMIHRSEVLDIARVRQRLPSEFQSEKATIHPPITTAE